MTLTPPMGADGNYCACLTGAECSRMHDKAAALVDALAIARELARLARCMDAPPERSIGTQVALLEDLERRVGVRA